MNNEEHILRVENLTFSYNKKKKDNPKNVIDDITFELEKGKITVLIGANGCGKSTLFHLITGSLKPDSGKITLDNTDTLKMKRKEFSKIVAAVHQYNTSPADMTVERLVEMGRTPYKGMFSYSSSADDKAAVENALEITDTKKYANEMISCLSGGQRQRVWLAMALAQQPDILLLDEITTYLDIKYQYDILALIKKLNKTQGLTVLMVLHDINQASSLGDNAIIMKDGKILDNAPCEKAVCKENIESAFGVKADIVNIGMQRYCIIGQ